MKYRDKDTDALFPPKPNKPKVMPLRFYRSSYGDDPMMVSIASQTTDWRRFVDLKMQVVRDQIMGKKYKFDDKGGIIELVDGVSIKEARDAIMGNEFAYDENGKELDALVKGDSIHDAKKEIMGTVTSKDSNGSEVIDVDGQNIRVAEINIRTDIENARVNINQNTNDARDNINANIDSTRKSINDNINTSTTSINNKIETAKNNINSNTNSQTQSIINAINDLWSKIRNYNWGGF